MKTQFKFFNKNNDQTIRVQLVNTAEQPSPRWVTSSLNASRAPCIPDSISSLICKGNTFYHQILYSPESKLLLMESNNTYFIMSDLFLNSVMVKSAQVIASSFIPIAIYSIPWNNYFYLLGLFSGIDYYKQCYYKHLCSPVLLHIHTKYL